MYVHYASSQGHGGPARVTVTEGVQTVGYVSYLPAHHGLRVRVRASA